MFYSQYRGGDRFCIAGIDRDEDAAGLMGLFILNNHVFVMEKRNTEFNSGQPDVSVGINGFYNLVE